MKKLEANIHTVETSCQAESGLQLPVRKMLGYAYGYNSQPQPVEINSGPFLVRNSARGQIATTGLMILDLRILPADAECTKLLEDYAKKYLNSTRRHSVWTPLEDIQESLHVAKLVLDVIYPNHAKFEGHFIIPQDISPVVQKALGNKDFETIEYYRLRGYAVEDV